MKLTERVMVEREITGTIRDLVMFVHYLREAGRIGPIPADPVLVEQAREFWDREHGE
jgi:hypothetical protein